MIAIEIEIEADGWRTVPDAEGWCHRAAAAIATAVPEAAAGATVTLLLADDAAIRDLNRTWRGQDKPTNVLSFPAPSGPGGARHLGDVALAFETVAREAGADGKPPAHHLAHLVAHGILHLLGHDHETDRDAELMERVETEAMARLGIADPHRVQA